MKYKSLRTKILFLLAVISLSLIISMETYHSYNKKDVLYKVSTEKFLVLIKTIRNFEKKQLQLYTSRVAKIQNNSNIIKAISNSSIDKVSADINLIISYYKKASTNLVHIHIYDTNKKLIYISDDEKMITHIHYENIVLNQAVKMQKQIVGYVRTKKDKYYYSITTPLIYHKKVVAYIEYGLKADNLFKILSKAGRYKYALYLKKIEKSSKKRELGTLVAFNSKIFKELNFTQEYIYKIANTNTIIPYKNRYYLIQQYDIEKDFQKDFAQIVMASNVTEFVQENKKTAINAFFISMLLLLLMLLIFYLVLTKLINRLVEDEKQLQKKSNHIQIILDYSENFIALFEKSELVLVNHSFLAFLDCQDMNSFLVKYPNLSDIFETDKSTLSLLKSKNNLEWIKKVYDLKENERIVAINHPTLGLHYFNIKITRAVNQAYSNIVVFSNITSLYQKSKENEYKSNHDDLTNIYNRQYFDIVVKDAIQTKESISLLMLDLDFFKKVNDTYGHQSGDDVLVKFTQVISHNIRKNDIFARWGGEEFVILIFDLSNDIVEKIAETLRKKIEEADFNLESKITCSIGVSIYKENEKFQTLLKRVDEALYIAKENGRNQVVIR